MHTSNSGHDGLKRVGLVAGRGRFPLLFCEAAKAQGIEHLAVVAMHEETERSIESLADHVDWVHVGQVGKTIKCLKRQEVACTVFAGQIKPGRLFKGLRPDLRAVKLLASLREKNAESIFGAIADEFAIEGITVLPSTTFLEWSLAGEGILGKHRPTRSQEADVELGRRIALEVSRMDIGQTVVVKNGTVLAVEGFEGTDRAILRGGELGKGDVVVVKVAKPRQDMRFDVPCIGLRTVESLREAGACVLAVQSEKTLFIDKAEVLQALDAAKITVVGFRVGDPDSLANR